MSAQTRTPEEIAQLKRSVAQWIDLATAANLKRGMMGGVTSADAEHSALLERLLSGREALPQPPPRRYSYPWYDLIDMGEGQAWEVGEYVLFPDKLVIDQGSQWTILERRSDRSYLVQCDTNGQIFSVTPQTPDDDRHDWALKRQQVG